MAYNQETGTVELRKEVVDKVLKGFSTATYKFKQAVTISKTNAWKNTFFRENPDPLTEPSGNTVKGIPRGANFPQAVVSFEEVNSWIEKYGLEDFIHWEDILTNDVDVQRRTIFRITERVVKAVDDEIWRVLTDGASEPGGAVGSIQSITITGGRQWDAASAAIIDDLMQAKQLIAEKNYDTSNLLCYISPQDHRSIVKYLTDKGAQFPSVGNEMAKNGHVGKLAGISLVQSNSVTASYALVCVPKVCGTWKQAVPLQSNLEVDPFKGTRIRVVEMGVTQLTDPECCVLIIGTQAAA